MPRQPAPVSPPVVCSIAGSDSGGGAGIQADVKTIEACGGFATTAITSVTAQNTTGVHGTHGVPLEDIEAQCDAVFSDFDVSAVKTGMLATSDVVELVTDRLAERELPAIVDPVMVAASGDRLLDEDAEAAYTDLVAEATLVTPNADEATVLTGTTIESEADAIEAGEHLVSMGADAALLKGGHVPGDHVVDVLVTGDTVEMFRHDRIDTDATHGSGCTLSSAIATHLAHGDDLTDAVSAGIDLLGRAVRYNLAVGQGPGAVHHLAALRDDASRDPTAAAVRSVVARLHDRDVSPLVPDAGMAVVGATPYAESPESVAAVEGGIVSTVDGVTAAGDVRFGASTRTARVLLAAREHTPDLRFGVRCALTDAVADALETRAVVTANYEYVTEVDAEETVEASVQRAFEHTDGTPAALLDWGGVGRTPSATLLAADPTHLEDRTLALLDAVEQPVE